MAAIVCQSYLEAQLVETRIHRLRLPSPKPLTTLPQPIDLPFKSCFRESNTKPHCDENSYKTDTTVHQSGWSSIQSLSNVSQGPKESTTYVHPQVKQSSVRLSPKSLELCTENLGNETGSDMIESGIELLSSSSSSSECGGYDMGTMEQKKKPRRVLDSRNFPPPLTTIRGSESIRVRPHREGGRLVLEVTKVPSCFQAERSHGRLRLCLWTDPQEQDDDDDDEDDDDIEEDFENETNDQTEDVVDEEEGVSVHSENKDKNESWSNVEVGVRMEKYEIERSSNRSRCKEGDHENNELLIKNWGEPLWVATS